MIITNILRRAMNEGKSFFFPPEIQGKEIEPLIMGYSYQRVYQQGFYRTGEFYLIFNDNIEHRILVIYFDEDTGKLQKSIIKLTYSEPCRQDIFFHRICHRIFDPHDARLIYIIPKRKNDQELTIVEIYVFNILISREDREIKIDSTTKPAASVIFKSEVFDFEYDYGFREKDTTTLVVQAYFERTLTRSKLHPPKFSFHYIKFNKLNIIYGGKTVMDLTTLCPKIKNVSFATISKNKLYLFIQTTVNEKEYEEGRSKAKKEQKPFRQPFLELLYILLEGGLHIYTLPHSYDERHFYHDFRGSQHAVLFQNINIIIYRLKADLDHFITKAILTYDGAEPKRRFFHLDSPIKRFDLIVLPIETFSELPGKFYTLRELKSQRQITETIKVDGHYESQRLNWNMQELAVTYYDRDNPNSNLLFKIHPLKLTEQFFSLKHFARMKVLASFSEDYLRQQNIPSTLFEFLGIEK